MFKSREIVLNLYTQRPDIFHYAQWQRAATEKPDWWKSLKSVKPTIDAPFRGNTMKYCSGFNDLYRKAFIVPLWSEVLLGIGKKDTSLWRYSFADKQSKIDCHPQFQRGTWLPETEYQHFKFNVPWMAECTHDIDFLYTSAEYQSEDPFQFMTLNGLVNYKSMLGTDVNVMFKRGIEDQEILLQKDTPLAMVVPLTDKKVKIKHHLLSQDEMDRKRFKGKPFLWFNNGYQKAKKCPFHK